MRSGAYVVIDTNILLVANNQHPDISPDCVIACVKVLDGVRKKGKIVIDDAYEIITEYGNKTSPNTGNRAGDGFLKWILQNMNNSDHVESVPIAQHTERGYAEFPEDTKLNNFDPSDRKFVATARSHHKKPPILQGTDSKWLEWKDCLSSHGVEIEFLCLRDVMRFRHRKRNRTL